VWVSCGTKYKNTYWNEIVWSNMLIMPWHLAIKYKISRRIKEHVNLHCHYDSSSMFQHLKAAATQLTHAQSHTDVYT
jgi:hypothetical protein